MDGAILIDQAKVLAGSVTPGDTPGFPVTINKPGSYRLSGNLTVPRVGVNGIVLTTSNVTIDLNGFQISGSPGTGEPAGSGITDNGNTLSGIAVRNGTIIGCQVGVGLNKSRAVIEGMQLYGCGVYGLRVGSGSIVKDNVMWACQVGVTVDEGSVVSGNIISHSGIDAISVHSGSVVCNNVVSDNFGGLRVGTNSIVKDNAAMRNQGGGIQIDANSTIIGNTASQNYGKGISIACPCTVIGNTAVNNTEGNIVYSGTGCTKANNTAP